MTPDSVETRLRQVEDRTARLEQRVVDLAREVAAVLPLVRELGELVVEVRGLKEDVGHVRTHVALVEAQLRDRDQSATQERRSVRVALIGLTGVISASLIAAAATIIIKAVFG